MKNVVITNAYEMKVQEVPIPTISPQEVLIKVKACGICHSDFELISGKYIIPFSYPITPGHEWTGEIVQVGSDVKTFQVGDRVTGECVIGCGTCPLCSSGNFSYCPDSDHFGFTIDGADSEYTVARPEWLHRLPDSMDWKIGALIEPFCVGYYSLSIHGGVDAGDTTVILGGGPIGLCTLAAAVGMGSKMILVEPNEFRQNIAKKLGADYVINPFTENVAERVKELTNGLGADLVVEASGNPEAMKTSLDIARNSGRISFTGINIGQVIPVELGKVQIKGLNIRGIVGSPYVWDKVIAFLEKSKLDLSPIITHEFPLEQAIEAFETARQGKECIKVQLINPN